MNNQFFITNTYGFSGFENWHSKSLSGMYKYCSMHNIKLNVMNENDFRIKNLISKSNNYLCPLLRKAVRFYSAVESGADYCFFVDMDTLILDMSKNISDYISEENQYINCFNISSEDLIKQKNTGQLRPYPSMKLEIHKLFKSEYPETICRCDTGYSCFSRQFCLNFLDFLSDNNLDMTSSTGINNLVEITKHGQALENTCNTAWVHDEHLIELFLSTNANYKNYNIIGTCNNSVKMCSSHYHVNGNSNRSVFPELLIDNVEKSHYLYLMAKQDCVLHHLLMSKEHVKRYFSMFEK